MGVLSCNNQNVNMLTGSAAWSLVRKTMGSLHMKKVFF